MGKYHIKDFEALSGIKAHTIRIWEQRYGLLKPQRSSTNIRQYSDDDLKLLLNVSTLNRNGFKISKLAQMGRAEIEEQVKEDLKVTIRVIPFEGGDTPGRCIFTGEPSKSRAIWAKSY